MMQDLKILLLEDDPLDEELIRSQLKKGGLSFSMRRASTRSAYLKLLDDWQPDLVLSDFILPDYRGDEALEDLKKRRPELPFIIITGTVGEETAVSFMKEGAWDYILKQNLVRLVPAIQNAISLKSERLITESYKKQLFNKSEEQVLLLNNIDIQVWHLTDSTHYGVVNQAHASFFNMKPAEMENRQISKVLPKHAASALLEGNREVFESGKKIQEERWINNGEGEDHCLLITRIPQTGPGGKASYVICTAEDITELKRIEENIRASELKYRRMFENTGSAIVIFGDDGIISMCNSHFEELSGYSREEIIEKLHWSAFVAEKDLEKMRHYHDLRTRGQAAPSEYEFTLKRRDRSERQIFLQISLIPDSHHRIVSLIDVTSLKEAQLNIEGKEKELRALLEYSPVPQVYEDFSGPRNFIQDLRERGIPDIREYLNQHPQEYRKCRSLVKIIGLNKAFLELFGVSGQAELEEKLFDIITEDSIRMFLSGLLSILDGETVFESETKYFTARGEEILARTRWVVVPNHRERLDMVVVSILDISEQRRSATREKQYLDNFRLLSDNALKILEINNEDELFDQIAGQIHRLVGQAVVLISAFNEEDNTLTVKTVAGLDEFRDDIMEILGRDVTGLSFILPDEYRADMLKKQLTPVEGGIHEITFGQIPEEACQAIENAIGMKSSMGIGFVWGERLSGTAIILLREGHNPVIPEIVETLLKQTSVAILRLKLESQLKILSSAIDHSYASIIITDISGRISYVNPRFSQLTGYEAAEIIGRTPSILKSGMQPDAYYADLWQTIKAGKEWRGEFRNRKKDGDIFWALTSISGVRNERGDITHYVAIEEDITERKIIEQELIHAKERAEESDRLKTAFLANLSHEIRTPMNAIAGFSELITNADLSRQEQKEYFGIIRSNVSTLSKLIDDIIDFSKLELGQTKCEEVECFLDDLLREIRIAFQEEVKNLQKKIEIRLAPGAASNLHILTDPVRLRQVFSNLISNSIKFTHEGFIEFGCTVENEGYIRFSVVDTGVGIPKEKTDMIFERFRQLDDASTRQYGGTGLGLAISKGLVEIMGGEIWVKSELGKGTSFFFTLPYKPVDADVAARQPEGIPYADIDWSGKTILVAESNPTSFQVIEAGLKPTRAKLIWSREEKEVLEACRASNKLDLVLLDINLPGQGSKNTIKSILEMGRNVPFIAQTLQSMPENHSELMEAGFRDYIAKPFRIRSLITILRKYL